MRDRIVAIVLALAITTFCASGVAAGRRRAVRHPSPPDVVFIMGEQTAGSLLSINTFCGASDRWRIDHNELLRQFAATFANTAYDFMLLFPTKSLCSNYEWTQNQNIAGIGGCTGCVNDLAPSLKAFAVIDLFSSWKFLTDHENDPQVAVPTFLDVVLHEIGHYWLVFILGLEVGDGSHWPNNLDLLGGDHRYVDPMASYHWIIREGQEACVDGNDRATVTAKFSDLSLYLMGLVPPEAVAPIQEHVFASKPEDPIYNRYGPDCRASHQFLFTRTLTVQDFVARNGVRTPSYPETQRNFRVAVVVLTATGDPIPQEFVDYVKSLTAAVPQEWLNATGGRSEMSLVSVIKR